jgi:uncharacterized protein YkwD
MSSYLLTFPSFNARSTFFFVLSSFLFATALDARAQSASNRSVAQLVTAATYKEFILPNTNQPVPVPRLVTAAPIKTVPVRAHFAAPQPTVVPVTDFSSANILNLEHRAFDLINEQRALMNEPLLVWDEELCRIARLHSENMARLGFFSHTGADGLDVVGRARLSNIKGWSVLSENIAYNQGFDDPVAFAVERWMISNKHRDNILDARLTRSGLGIARSTDGRVFFTQVFIAR